MMLLSARIKLYIIVSNNYNDQCKHQINHANQPQFDKIKVTDGLVTPGARASSAMILTDFSFRCSIFSFEVVTSTVECPYNAVQCMMILHTIHWLLWQNLNRDLYSPQTPHIPPSQGSYVVCILRNLEEIHRIITASHCNLIAEMGFASHRVTFPHRYHDISARGCSTFTGALL